MPYTIYKLVNKQTGRTYTGDGIVVSKNCGSERCVCFVKWSEALNHDSFSYVICSDTTKVNSRVKVMFLSK